MRWGSKNYKTMSDEDLMRLFLKGNQKSFEEIYLRYKDYLLNFFYRKLWQDREKAEDFVQDIFKKVIDRPHLFDPTKSFKTWVFTMANNMCKNEYKKQEVRKDSRGDLEEGKSTLINQKEADQKVDEMDFSKALSHALLAFKEGHQEVFKLRHYEGLSMKEIADILEINEGTVKSRLHYVTKQLAFELSVYQKLIKD